MGSFVTALMDGLCNGSLYALIAMGFTLAFAASGVIDFSRGAIVLAGSLVTYTVETGAGLRWPLSLAAALAVGGVLGAATYAVSVAPVLHRRGSMWLVSTLGFGVVLQAALILIYGSGTREVNARFLVGTGAVSFGNAAPISDDKLLILPIAILLCLCLWAMMRFTTWGRMVRAVKSDRDAAAARGISIPLVAGGAFAIAGMLAGFAGFLNAPVEPTLPALGFGFTLSGFIAFVVGGSGSVWGALLGGWLIGACEQLGGRYIDASVQHLVALVVLLAVVLIRPQGVFSRSLRLV